MFKTQIKTVVESGFEQRQLQKTPFLIMQYTYWSSRIWDPKARREESTAHAASASLQKQCEPSSEETASRGGEAWVESKVEARESECVRRLGSAWVDVSKRA